MAEHSQYLTEEEIGEYCDMLPVTSEQVMFASGMIDAFIGTVNGASKFTTNQTTQKNIVANRKGIVKLKNTPVVSIDKVELCIPNGFNYTSLTEIPLDYITYDEEDGYIYVPRHMYGNITPNNLYGVSPIGINVTYTYGYSEIPNNVKIATAMIAMNISQQGGFTNIQSMTNLDTRFALTDPSVFTKDVKRLLQVYR